MKLFFKGTTRFYLALLFLGILLAAISFSDVVASFRPPVDFADLLDGVAVQKGSHIEGELVACFPPFASQSKSYSYGGTAVGAESNRNFYLVPTADGFLGLQALQSQTEQMDALARETAAQLNGTGQITSVIRAEGIVKPLDDELAGYFREYLLEAGFSDEELDAMGAPMFVEVSDLGVSRAIFNGGIALFALAALLISLRSRKLMRREQETAEQTPCADAGITS